MFECVSTLGNGAFGQVYKVKCLESTKISETGGERVLLKESAIKKVQSKVALTRGSNMASKIPGQGRSLIKDQFYVIKVIDVAEVPEKIGLEAL